MIADLVWGSSYSMRRISSQSKWTLFDSVANAELSEATGDEFDSLYRSCEVKKMGSDEIDARELWDHILKTQIKTGGPAIIFKDSVNSECALFENAGGPRISIFLVIHS